MLQAGKHGPHVELEDLIEIFTSSQWNETAALSFSSGLSMAKAIKDIEAVEDRLIKIKDKEITVWINEKVRKKEGGMVQRFARGGRLPGYGGGDRISALLEAGEFVVRKEAVAKYGQGVFAALNNLQLPAFPEKFAAGGPTSDQAGAGAAADGGSLPPITLNYYGSGSLDDAKRMATMVMGEFKKIYRGRS